MDGEIRRVKTIALLSRNTTPLSGAEIAKISGIRVLDMVYEQNYCAAV